MTPSPHLIYPYQMTRDYHVNPPLTRLSIITSRKFTGHRVKNLGLSTFTNDEVKAIEASGGNESARNLWLYDWNAKSFPVVRMHLLPLPLSLHFCQYCLFYRAPFSLHDHLYSYIALCPRPYPACMHILTFTPPPFSPLSPFSPNLPRLTTVHRSS